MLAALCLPSYIVHCILVTMLSLKLMEQSLCSTWWALGPPPCGFCWDTQASGQGLRKGTEKSLGKASIPVKSECPEQWYRQQYFPEPFPESSDH